MTAIQELSDTRTPAGRNPGANAPRILFLIDEIEAITEGGTERQILQLIHLSRRLGYDPCLAVLRGTYWLTEERTGCPIHRAELKSFVKPNGWLACLRLIRWMRRQNFQMAQMFFVESNAVGPWLGRMAGVPVIVGSRRNLNESMRTWMRRLQRWANRSTDYIVANSRVAAEVAHGQERVPSGKLRVAYNGIELENFAGIEQDRASMRWQLGIADDEVLVGNVSGLRSVKGLDHFVEAARIAVATEPKFRFVIVGDGTERAAIEDRIRGYGLQDTIRLAGAQENVLPYLAAMDIGVLSSLAEGFSNSLLEYMAAGLPVVATDVGGNREALDVAGLLVLPANPQALADAILQLRSLELRHRFGQAARQRVKRFSVVEAEKRMEEIYGEMLAKANLRRIG